MTEPYFVWVLLAGFAIGASIVWFALGRLPRESLDVSAEERAAEAAWISAMLAERGRSLAPEVVDEILELNQLYLAGPAAQPAALSVPPVAGRSAEASATGRRRRRGTGAQN